MKYLILLLLAGCASSGQLCYNDKKGDQFCRPKKCYLQSIRGWCQQNYDVAGQRFDKELQLTQEVCCEKDF